MTDDFEQIEVCRLLSHGYTDINRWWTSAQYRSEHGILLFPDPEDFPKDYTFVPWQSLFWFRPVLGRKR